MTPALRKLAVTVHISFSIGWLGATAAFLVLSIAGLTSHSADVVRGTYISLDLIGRFAILPLCFAGLATGLIQALGTPWGLFRYYWVVIKFGLTTVATMLLLQHYFGAVAAAAQRVSGAPGEELFSPDLSPLKVELVRAPALAIVLLLFIATLGVYKPWGLTACGRRRLQEQGKIDHKTHYETPLGVKLFLALCGLVALMVVVLHLTGHGLGGHGH
jgi:hypothetical protein